MEDRTDIEKSTETKNSGVHQDLAASKINAIKTNPTSTTIAQLSNPTPQSKKPKKKKKNGPKLSQSSATKQMPPHLKNHVEIHAKINEPDGHKERNAPSTTHQPAATVSAGIQKVTNAETFDCVTNKTGPILDNVQKFNIGSLANDLD